MSNLILPTHVAKAVQKKKIEAEKEKEKKESAKLPEPTGWRILVLPHKGAGKTKGGVYLSDKTIQETQISRFDTIVCLDVLEHLSDPAFQLDVFHEIMGPNSIGLFNWYFHKGVNNEYPFHIDDLQTIEQFFKTLQSKFLEVFHPILITARSYKKN